MTDKLDAAVKQVEAQANQVEMVKYEARIYPDGRPIAMFVPKDVTDLELLALMGQVLAMGDQLRAQRPVSKLVLPISARPT